MNGEEILVPLMGIIGIAAVLIAFFTSRHRERMAMVEKGMASEDIKALYAREVRRDPLSSLKWGILFVFGGLAVLLGVWLRDYYFANDGVVVGMVCLFVGIGLVIFYTIAAKKVKE